MSTTSNSGWYTNAYSGPFRSGRLRAPSLIPGARRPGVIAVQQTLVVDVAHVHNANPTGNGAGEESKAVKRRETIFGPDVGEDDEPGWTDQKREQVPVEKVKQWVEKTKSEEGLHATTTLQALVNLKRPTLLLQQLDVEDAPRTSTDTQTKPQEEDIVSASPSASKRESFVPSTDGPGLPLHLLKFNYDATTPQVRITLEVYPTPQPPIEGKESIVEGETHRPKLVYTGLHSGGFAQTFTLPHTSALDLSSAIVEKEEEVRSSESHEKTEATLANVPALPDVPEPVPVSADGNGRRRFGLFRRNREEDLEEGMNGIELTNTNVNGTTNANGEAQIAGGEGEEKKEKEIEQGMRLLIRIDGVGAEGQQLARTNAQLTHILITGTWTADNHASSTNAVQFGKRVWVIKVVRREAMIGSHTFLLKEIYGLSSASTSSSSSYPPTQDDPYASTPNECIVCLTSPRDVVLLPCRHLVVCRDCAVGMVEYGAGGKVARRDEGEAGTDGAVAAAGAGTGATGTGTGVNAPQVAGGTTTTGRERRKKKVKGWYCPVCRQPYTSLLRLALPDSDKPGGSPDAPLARVASRAASVRTARSGRAPSLAPTLPEGAERMLDALRPPSPVEGMDESERREWEQQREMDAEAERERERERPQFVLSNGEVDERETAISVGGDGEKEDKAETEHREHKDVPSVSPASEHVAGHEGEGEGEGKDDGKGWKVVA